MTKTIGILGMALCVASAFGQVTVKSSPAADALVSAAKDLSTEKKSLDVALQQARSTLDTSQKAIKDQLTALQKDLNDKLKADKKYAPDLDKMEKLQKQLQDSGNEATNKFNQVGGPISTKVAQDQALIDGLIPVVRKENGLPDTATFDVETQTWKAK